MARGASVHSANREGYTPLLSAVVSGKANLLAYFIGLGAALDVCICTAQLGAAHTQLTLNSTQLNSTRLNSTQSKGKGKGKGRAAKGCDSKGKERESERERERERES